MAVPSKATYIPGASMHEGSVATANVDADMVVVKWNQIGGTGSI